MATNYIHLTFIDINCIHLKYSIFSTFQSVNGIKSIITSIKFQSNAKKIIAMSEIFFFQIDNPTFPPVMTKARFNQKKTEERIEEMDIINYIYI